jgi:hypothetical protein
MFKPSDCGFLIAYEKELERRLGTAARLCRQCVWWDGMLAGECTKQPDMHMITYYARYMRNGKQDDCGPDGKHWTQRDDLDK